jgi:hypothetical protein
MRLVAMAALAALPAVFVGCGTVFPTVVGSGAIERDERPVSPFETLEFTGSGEVTIVQGDRDSVTIETDDNILPLIRTDNKGHSLRIGLAKDTSIRPSRPIQYTVTVRSLSEIRASGSCAFTIDDFEADKLTIKVAGSSNVSLGRIRVPKLSVSLSGSSTVEADGTSEKLKFDVSGSGKIHGFDLKAHAVEIAISGSASAEVSPRDSLDVRISGNGDVKYRGDPKHVKQSISGWGHVGKVD